MTTTRALRSSSASRPDAATETETETEPRRPGRPRDARVAGAVLQATLYELVENGYAGLSMDKVAARAGVSKATIYRRWPSREELILDAWRSMDPHDDSDIDTGHLRTDLYAMCDEYSKGLCTSQMGSLLPQIVAAVHQSPKLAELFAAFVEEQIQPLEIMYRRAQTRGELRPDLDVRLAMKLLAGSIFYSILIGRELMSPDDLRASVDMVLRGLLVPGSDVAV